MRVFTAARLERNAHRMRCRAETDKPETLAIARLFQWVAAAAFVSDVIVTPSAIFSSLILRGAPRQGSLASPSDHLAANR